MSFYFYGRYTYTDGDDKEVERDMHAIIPYFRDSKDYDEYEKWEDRLEDFFSFFSLIHEQKCRYAQMKLIEEAYWWWEDSHIDCRYWFVLQDFHTRYAPYLERPKFSDLVAECKELLAGVGKILESKLVEVIEEPELEVDDESEPRPGPGPKIIVELVSLQEKISSRPT